MPQQIMADKNGNIYYFLEENSKIKKFHRLDGPACIQFNGAKFWYINGHPITNKITRWAKEMNIDLDNLSDEDKMLIRIYWENYDGK